MEKTVGVTGSVGSQCNVGDRPSLPRYRCHKQVWALKIKHILPGRLDCHCPGATLEFEEPGYAPVSVRDTWVTNHDPQPGGYLVIYEDGYRSFSPAKAFEEGYTRVGLNDVPKEKYLYRGNILTEMSREELIDGLQTMGLLYVDVLEQVRAAS